MIGKASADTAEGLRLPITKKCGAVHRMTHVIEYWAWSSIHKKHSIRISDSLKPQNIWLNQEEQAIMELFPLGELFL